MSNKNEISHGGKVIHRIGQGKFLVKIISQSACSGCHARGACSAADMAEKQIDTISTQNLQIGDEVKVIMEEKLGIKAIFYSFFLPFIVMMIVLLVLSIIGCSEITAGLFSIASLAPYYFLLYLARKRIAKDFIFRAEKIESNH